VAAHEGRVALLLALMLCTPLQARAQSTGWLLDLAAEGGHEDAVRFQSVDDPGDQYARVRADLLHHWKSLRGTVDVIASGDATRYSVLRDLDRSNYGVAARATRQLTRRANGTLFVAARNLLATDLTVSPDVAISGSTTEAPSGQVSPGPRLPRVAAHIFTNQAQLGYRLSPRTTATLAADYLHASFDSQILVASNTATGRAVLQHQVSQHGSAIFQADLQRGSEQKQLTSSDNVAAGWEQEIGGITSRVITGATHITTPSGSRVEPSGAVQLTLGLAGGTAAMEYARKTSPALGLGTLLTTNRVLARYQRSVLDGWGASMSASRAWWDDPNPTIGRSGNTDCAVDLKRVIGGRFLVGGAVTYRRREQEQLPTLRGFDTRVYLGVAAGA
jgi:hypothetical protein